MAHWHEGFKDIEVKLISCVGDDLARQVVMFGQHGEFYQGLDEYSPDDPLAQKIVDEIIKGKTFPKYCLEGHSVVFDIQGISRVNLAQLTRERGFFCSESSAVRPLTQDFIVPLSIYRNKEWMQRLEKIQSEIEDLYVDMNLAGIPYPDSRYFGFHAQTISLCYTAPYGFFSRSCNSRTENNFADEINYVYRLMLRELKKEVAKCEDPLSKKLWNWLIPMCDKKGPYLRDAHFNNDFKRIPEPEGYEFPEPANNDFRKSNWYYELIRIYKEEPDLLLPGEKEMVESWLECEKNGAEVPSTYDESFEKAPPVLIKQQDYYKKI